MEPIRIFGLQVKRPKNPFMPASTVELDWKKSAGVLSTRGWDENVRQRQLGFAQIESNLPWYRALYRRHTSRSRGASRVSPLDAEHGAQRAQLLELGPNRRWQECRVRVRLKGTFETRNPSHALLNEVRRVSPNRAPTIILLSMIQTQSILGELSICCQATLSRPRVQPSEFE